MSRRMHRLLSVGEIVSCLKSVLFGHNSNGRQYCCSTKCKPARITHQSNTSTLTQVITAPLCVSMRRATNKMGPFGPRVISAEFLTPSTQPP